MKSLHLFRKYLQIFFKSLRSEIEKKLLFLQVRTYVTYNAFCETYSVQKQLLVGKCISIQFVLNLHCFWRWKNHAVSEQ